MPQNKRQSLIEAVTQVFVGMLISVYLVSPLAYTTWDANDPRNYWALTIVFTIVSICRSYAFRRFFNWLHHKDEGPKRLTGKD